MVKTYVIYDYDYNPRYVQGKSVKDITKKYKVSSSRVRLIEKIY